MCCCGIYKVHGAGFLENVVAQLGKKFPPYMKHVLYCVHRIPSLDHTPSQLNPVHTFTLYSSYNPF
jgi:hypothetical protein